MVQLVVAFAGVGLRIRQYLFDRSLWADEAMIALNVVHKSYGGLSRTLDMLQSAPIGWLWTEKTATEVFGTSELALRLPELLSGCLAVAGFVLLARRLLTPVAATVAVILFSLSPALIFFSSDGKPYGFDVAVVTGILLLATRPDRGSLRDEIVLAAVLTVSVFFSYPAAFVGAGVMLVRGATHLRARDLPRSAVIAAGAVATLAVFLVQYLRSVRPTADNPAMKHFWASGYAPRPLHVRSTLSWLVHEADKVARYPLEASVPVLLLLLVAAGGVTVVRRSGAQGWPVLLALALTLLAAIAAKYPFRDRMTLFAVPLVFLLVGWGIDLVATDRAAFFRAGAAALALGCFAGTFPHTVDLVARPYRVTEFRQALSFAEAHLRPGDRILTNYQANAIDEYYLPGLRHRPSAYFAMGLEGCQSPSTALSWLAGSARVWLVFGNFVDIPPVPAQYLAAFRAVGRQDYWHATSSGAGVALFTLDSRLPARIAYEGKCVSFGPTPQA